MFLVEQKARDKVPQSQYTVADFINITKGNTQDLIKYFKLVNDFTTLDKNTQIAILKARMMSSLLLRSLYIYKKDSHAWCLPQVKEPISCDNLVKALGPDSEESMIEVFKLADAFQREFGQDPYLYAILHLIMVFSPSVAELTHRHVISDLQTNYITLLKHFLESKFSYSRSKHYFPFLLSKINTINKLGEKILGVVAEMPLKDVDPLMSEILSL